MNEQLANAMIVLTVVIDPLGCALIFAGLTRDHSPDERRRTAIRGAALAASMLVLFLFIGDGLLRSLGIGLAAFRIAGGALLFLLAVDMVFVRRSGIRSVTPRERVEAEVKEDISVFPLAFPLIAGPGALTTVLLYSASTAPFGAASLAMLVVICAVVLVTLGCLLFSDRIMRLMGETGANVVSRLLGLILTALATQFVLDGVKAGFNLAR